MWGTFQQVYPTCTTTMQTARFQDMSVATSEQSSEPTIDHIVYYDGECGMCDRFVSFVMDHDRNRTFYFAALQGKTAAARLGTEYTAEIKSVVYELHGKAWTHSSAVCRVFWDLGGIWSVAGTMLWIIPAPLRDFGYRCVARIRHRLFPMKETCRMPTPEERSRVLP